jgi:hypothetical protein
MPAGEAVPAMRRPGGSAVAVETFTVAVGYSLLMAACGGLVFLASVWPARPRRAISASAGQPHALIAVAGQLAAGAATRAGARDAHPGGVPPADGEMEEAHER